jgi:hypothetical protein
MQDQTAWFSVLRNGSGTSAPDEGRRTAVFKELVCHIARPSPETHTRSVDITEVHCFQEGRKYPMLPDVDNPVWVLFVTGKKPVQSSKATVNLLIHSNKMNYEMDASPANVKKLVAKTHSFFTQYEAIFSSEIAKIAG